MPSILAKALQLRGKRVRITTIDGETWEGTLAAVQTSPTLFLSDGGDTEFPPFAMTGIERLEEID